MRHELEESQEGTEVAITFRLAKTLWQIHQNHALVLFPSVATRGCH